MKSSECPWAVIPTDPDDPQSVDAAEFAQGFLDAAWEDPKFKSEFWAEYKKKVQAFIAAGRL